MTLPSRRHAVLSCVSAALSAVACGALLCAAALVPAPAAVLPLIVVVGVGFPMVAAYELPRSIAVLRARRPARATVSGGALDRDALDDLRRHLDALPETQHPLGL